MKLHPQEPGAVHSTVLDPNTFETLINAWQNDELNTLSCTDIDRRTLFEAGRPAPDFEDLLDPLLHQRGCLLITISHTSGSGETQWVWMNGNGILHTRTVQTGSELTAELGGSLYRILIDRLGLAARPAPAMGVEPVTINRRALIDFADDSSGSVGPHRAAAELADVVAAQSPRVAECLRRGEARLITLSGEWQTGRGEARCATTFLDTPAGMLLHAQESGFLKTRHTLEPAPAWVIFSQVVAGLPRVEDIAQWDTDDQAAAL